MKTLAIIGYPIGHSISPAIYNATFPAMGIDARYEAWSTPPEDVPAAIERLRGDDMMGMNVTVPHKAAVLSLLDEVEASATAIGAVNCIRKFEGRLIGHNTDKYGFVRSLREAGCEPRGMRVLMLGAGGSARAVGYGLVEAGASSIAVGGRNVESVTVLVESLRKTQGDTTIESAGWQDEGFAAACQQADLIVNCTPVGMRHTDTEADSPLTPELIRPGVWVSDLVYNPLETPLLRMAAKRGARPVAGLEMLVYQAAESVRLWTGREPPIDVMRKAASAALFGGG